MLSLSHTMAEAWKYLEVAWVVERGGEEYALDHAASESGQSKHTQSHGLKISSYLPAVGDAVPGNF